MQIIKKQIEIWKQGRRHFFKLIDNFQISISYPNQHTAILIFLKFWEFFNHIDISNEFKDLINSLISITPSKRLSTDEILKHPWLIKHLGLNDNNDNYQNKLFDKEIIDEFNSRKKII